MTAVVTVLVSGLLIGAIYAAIGAGFSIALGACRVVNFAHGQFAVLGAYIAYLAAGWGVPLYLGGLLGVAVAAVVGYALHRFIIEPFAGADAAKQIVVTVGIALIIESLIALKFGTEPINARGAWPEGHTINIFVPISLARVLGAIGSAVVLLSLRQLLTRHPLGLAIRAAGENVYGCELTGYSGRTVLSVGFGIAAAMGAAAGALLLPALNFTPYEGLNLTLIAFIVVVVGGAGNLAGAIFAGLLLGGIESFVTYQFTPDAARIATFVVMLLALAVRTIGKRGVIASTVGA